MSTPRQSISLRTKNNQRRWLNLSDWSTLIPFFSHRNRIRSQTYNLPDFISTYSMGRYAYTVAELEAAVIFYKILISRYEIFITIDLLFDQRQEHLWNAPSQQYARYYCSFRLAYTIFWNRLPLTIHRQPRLTTKWESHRLILLHCFFSSVRVMTNI